MSFRIVIPLQRFQKSAGKKSSRKSGPKRRGWIPWRRLILTAGLLLFVAGVIGWTYLSAEVRMQFEGRLWTEPTRVYSDVLILERGQSIPADALVQRLDRSGYAAVSGPPSRPGQYLRSENGFQIYLREFDSPIGAMDARSVSLTLREGRIRTLSGSSGEPMRRATVEPELLATIHGGRQEERRVVPYDQLPPRLLQAVLAAEDSRFFDHHGVDFRGLVRAGLANLRQGGLVQGGSTITQQTVKNVFLDHRRTLARKLQELPLALVLDARYSKERILEVYLNEVYFGQRGPVAICGVEAASRFYFGHGVKGLTWAEAATLAGIIRSPGTYNPFVHEERSRERRDQVIDALVRLEWIDAEEAKTAKASPTSLASGQGGYSSAPYAVDYVRQQAALEWPELAEEAGLSIYTTLDTRIQDNAHRAVSDGLARLERNPPAGMDEGGGARGALQAAVVVVQPGDGSILAMVGGRDYGQSQFNRITQARRQPGSCFKPLVFAAGFEVAATRPGEGITPASLLEDEPIRVTRAGKTWEPRNYDRTFRGPVTARRALEESLNVPAIRVSQAIGVERIVETAHAAGIRSRLAAVDSLPLGTEEVTPLELATAYSTLASQGMYRESRILRAVRTESGQDYSARVLPASRAIQPEAAFLVNDILRGVFTRGTARSAAALGYTESAAGKTGTTDDTRDAWFVGHNGDILSLVWVGFDDNRRTGLTGASGALPIWVDLMKASGPAHRPFESNWPEGILVRSIDPSSGQIVSQWDPRAVDELFIQGTEPTIEAPSPRRQRLRRWWDRVRGRSQDRLPGV